MFGVFDLAKQLADGNNVARKCKQALNVGILLHADACNVIQKHTLPFLVHSVLCCIMCLLYSTLYHVQSNCAAIGKEREIVAVFIWYFLDIWSWCFLSVSLELA